MVANTTKATRKTKIITLIIIGWLLSLVIWFFLGETVTALLFSGFHDVEIWLATVGIGWIILSVLFIAALIPGKRNNK